jgi:hypothetical protein
MDPAGRLLIFEDLLGATPAGAGPGGAAPDQAAPGGTGSHGRVSASAERGGVMDLLLMVMLSGWDRTEAEYRGLLAEAEFAVRDVKPPPLRARQPESVIEAVPS